MFDYVKIGRSTCIANRLKSLSGFLPVDPALVAYVLSPNSCQEERFYHWLFRHYRANGEWFELRGDLLALLRAANATAASTGGGGLDPRDPRELYGLVRQRSRPTESRPVFDPSGPYVRVWRP